MAEHVDNLDLFGSGGHVWTWAAQLQAAKTLTSVGVEGAGRVVTLNGPIRGTVAGKFGRPGLLRASAASRALADAALTAIEEAIESRQRSGEAMAWTDDAGRSGSHLVIESYQRIGPRLYDVRGSSVVAAQLYQCQVVDLAPEERRS